MANMPGLSGPVPSFLPGADSALGRANLSERMVTAMLGELVTVRRVGAAAVAADVFAGAGLGARRLSLSHLPSAAQVMGLPAVMATVPAVWFMVRAKSSALSLGVTAASVMASGAAAAGRLAVMVTRPVSPIAPVI